ncbi:MAG: hypothetical protein RL213_1394 [Bacteroidota bacterium]|jgi:hypothetical protein
MVLKNAFKSALCLVALSVFAVSSYAQDPSFAVYVDNPTYVSSTQYEFDIMVKAMGSTTSFQLRTFQAGIYVDPTWVGAGTISVSNVAASSQLSSPGYNGSFNWNATDKLINCSVNIGVRTVSASCVSTTVGTGPIRVARLRLTNSIDFVCGPPNIKFNYVQNATPLRLRTSVSWRVGGTCATNYDMYYPNRPFTGQAYFNGELYSASDADGKSPSSLIANALPCTVPYNLTVFIEGYYVGSGTMTPVLQNQGLAGGINDVDTIVAELRSTADPSLVVSSLKGIVQTNGQATFIFPSAVANNSYWLVVKHRNCLETWSAAPVTMSVNGTYNFSNAASKAYASNQADMGGGVYAMYAGDMNQDGFVDPFDFSMFLDDSINFASGYFATDLNGDGFVDPFDFNVFLENSINFVMAVTP